MNALPPERFVLARQAFEALVDLPAEERRQRLAALAVSDPQVAAVVETLLGADTAAEAGPFLATPAGVAVRELVADWLDGESDMTGALVGAYRLIRVLGRGGMGEVWEAERADGQFEHCVALKLLKRGMDSEEVLRRFLRERQILARLTHPRIARLLDGGLAPDGRPYFVLERVDGSPITDHARERRLSIAERLQLCIAVSEAVDSAHRQLVVHRDLKPSNILVTAEGDLKLLDFGIAKLLGAQEGDDGATRMTALGLRALTPAYAAPEQILGEPVTTGTDVYALGVVLFELLTGRLPHQRSTTSAAALVTDVANEVAPRLSNVARQLGPEDLRRLGLPERDSARLDRRLKGDLETILARALDRTPARRYASASAFAEDLARYLEARPVVARLDSKRYRAAKFAKRHRVGVAFGGLAMLSLLGGLSAALWQARRAATSAATAETNFRRADRVQAFLIQLFEGSDPDHAQGETITARKLLEDGVARIGSELDEEPEVQAALWDAVSQIERRLGELELAEKLARAALVGRAARLPADDPQIALARLTLAEALLARGELEPAKVELAAAIPILVDAFGEDGDEVARARASLSAIHMHLGENDAALALSAAVLDRSTRRTGADSVETAQAALGHAMALGAADQYAAAEEVTARSVATFARRLGPDHPRTASARTTRGELLNYLGRHAEAEREMLAALPALKRALGPHPDVGDLLIRLGQLYISARRYDEAERAFVEALAIFEPLDHYETGSCLRMLGQVAFAREDYRRAEELYGRALERFRVKLGPQDQLTVVALANLGMARVRLGELESGRALLVEAIAGHTRLFGPEADELRSLLLSLGEAERRAGHPAVALAHHRRALAIADKTVGPEHIGAANARREIALDLAATGAVPDLDEARTMLDSALAILAKVDAAHPRLGEWWLDSALLARAAGDRDRMRRDAADAVRRLVAAHGDGDSRTRTARRLAAGG